MRRRRRPVPGRRGVHARRQPWRSWSRWPPPAMTPTPLHLRAGGRAVVRPAGRGRGARRLPTTTRPNPMAETLGGNCWMLCEAIGDRRAIDGRADIVTLRPAAPLAADLELTGPVEAVLYASTSAVDTDFTVAVVDVFEDGTVEHDPGRHRPRALPRTASTAVADRAGRGRASTGSTCARPATWSPGGTGCGSTSRRATSTATTATRTPASASPRRPRRWSRSRLIHHDADATPSHVVLPVVSRSA